MFGGKKDNGAAEAAKKAQEQQRALEAQRAAELAKLKQDEENNTTRDAARKRQAQAAKGATGIRDTILTGPLGDTTTPAGNQKTLLGL
jgi:sRNA-binding protein